MRRSGNSRRFGAALACAFGFTSTLTAAAQSAPQILILSNRADLVSGGDALVDQLPARVSVPIP